MTNTFNPTPKTVIENTINREYEKPQLKPPIFGVQLAESRQGRTLEKVLTSLANPTATAQNTFKPKPKSKLQSILSFFTF